MADPCLDSKRIPRRHPTSKVRAAAALELRATCTMKRLAEHGAAWMTQSGAFMSRQVLLQIELPDELAGFKLPNGVDHRLQTLLDRQDRGEVLSTAERLEAEGLVMLAEILSLLKLRSERLALAEP